MFPALKHSSISLPLPHKDKELAFELGQLWLIYNQQNVAELRLHDFQGKVIESYVYSS